MSSPIHKFLFSPPPSPPRRSLKKGSRTSDALNDPTTQGPFGSLTSLRTLFMDEHDNDSALDVVHEREEEEEELLQTPTLVNQRFQKLELLSSDPQRGFLGPSHLQSATATSSTSCAASSSSSRRRPSLLVHVEDVDATPKAPSRSTFSVPCTSAFPSQSPSQPFLAPAPRNANWRDTGRKHLKRKSLAARNVPSSPLPPLADTPGATFFALVLALAHSGSKSIRQPLISGRYWLKSKTTYRNRTIPRSLFRFALLACLIFGSWFIFGQTSPEGVVTVPVPILVGSDSTRGTLDRVRGMLALDSKGKAYIRDADREAYEPVQMRSAAMLQRAAANPVATRSTPTLPLPPTHELFALQSYLLQSPHNSIPSYVDTSIPLDAHLLLPYATSRKAGKRGDQRRVVPAASAAPASGSSDSWLNELERERADDIVIWSLAPHTKDAASNKEEKAVREALAAIHGPKRIISSIDLAGRSDRSSITAVLKRLDATPIDSSSLLVMIGNERFSGVEVVGMSIDALRVKMSAIGWAESADEALKRSKGRRKIHQAKWEKKTDDKKKDDKKAKARAEGHHKGAGKARLEQEAIEEEVQRILKDAGVREA